MADIPSKFSRAANWLKWKSHYAMNMSKFFLLNTFSREFKEDIKRRSSGNIIALQLCKYFGRKGNSEAWEYSFTSGDKRLKIWYKDGEDALDFFSAETSMRLEQKVDDEWAIVSQMNPSDLDFDKKHIPLPEDFILFYGELQPELVHEFAMQHYNSKRQEIENTPEYFFVTRLQKYSDLIQELNLISPLNNLPRINRSDLVDLEAKLEEIFSSKELPGVQIHKARRVTRELSIRYHEAVRARDDERIQKLRAEEDQTAAERYREYLARNVVSLEKVAASSKIPEVYFTGISGYRRDIGINVKSAWEANYARVLMSKGIPFLYEPQTFTLPVPEDMKSIFGNVESVNYTPDFQIQGTNRFVEVKGEWFNYRGHEAMAKTILFKRQHPELELQVIGVMEYRALEKEYKAAINATKTFCGWEAGTRRSGRNLATKPEEFS